MRRYPTIVQYNWLRRIALSPLTLTRQPGEPARYSLANGATVPETTVRVLIRNGWVRPQRDGLFDDCQTWVARKP